jgi:hypothetical protein
MHNIFSETVTASAYSQARQKLLHTAYIEINQDTLDGYYENDPESEFKRERYLGYRLIAGDGSVIILPGNKEVTEKFGSTKIKNGTDKYLGTYTSGLFMCHYDVLNNLAIDCKLEHCKTYEVNAAIESFKNFNKDDLLIYDRGFASYKMLATLIKNNKSFLIRFPTATFKAVQEMFSDTGPWSREITLKVPRDQKPLIQELGLPKEITVRFVKVILCTGEIEVLATSLRDIELTQDDFKELYNKRWGVESFFLKIKSRLSLENFTGKSVESIMQDFWSTIYISNLETVLTEDVNTELKMKKDKAHRTNKEQMVNKAVSFNVIKTMAFDLLYSKDDTDKTLEKMLKLFITNPVIKRPEREVKRYKTSARKSLNFQKRACKHVF